jgi:hypothetical protein
VLKIFKFHEAPHIVGQLHGVPRGILRVFINVLDENVFQNPQILRRTHVFSRANYFIGGVRTGISVHAAPSTLGNIYPQMVNLSASRQ